jgi:PAS domain S-box-containing protein
MEQKLQLEEEIESRVLIEEQLRESDNRFRLALDGSSNGVWDRNVVTGEIYYGENWYRTLGIEHKNSEEYSFENLLHPDDRERVLALREDHIQGKTPRYEAEYRLRNKAGDWQWILSRGQAVTRDKEGRAMRIIGTHTDITRLKEVEAELIRSQDELEQRVRERTVELYESNIALKVVLKKREEDRMILADQVLANSTMLIDPFLDRLKECRLTEQQQVLVDILRANIKELTSPFTTNFSTKLVRLTPAEIQIANLVKLGKRTKEIADIMHLSPGTISIHRKNIRKKLNLTHQKTNLQTVLSINA